LNLAQSDNPLPARPTYSAVCDLLSSTCATQNVIALITEHARLKEQPPACPQCGKADTRQLASLFNCKTASASF